MDTATAALYFRFCRQDNLPADVQDFLRQNTRHVADALPRSVGLELFEFVGEGDPTDYVGLPEPVGNEAWKDKERYQNARIARGEVSRP